MEHQTVRTISHDEIRAWAEERGGAPAVVVVGRGDEGHLRLDFGDDDERLERISWDDFFRVFEEEDLAFIYQEEPDGLPGYVYRFVPRNENEEDEFDEYLEMLEE